MVSGPGDEGIVAKLQGQDVRALEELYNRYGSFAYALAVRMLRDRNLAEDVVQEVFYNLWRQARTFDASRGSVRNWVLASTHHRAVDYMRQRSGKTRLDVDLTEAEYRLTGADPWASVVASTDRRLLRSVLEQLPAEQRRAVEMAYFEGLTQSEIAEASGVPLGTVKGRLRLALEKMRAILEAKGIKTAT